MSAETIGRYQDGKILPVQSGVHANMRAIRWPVFAIAILISSYFYVLPLIRYELAGIGTEFRLYDVVSAVYLVFVMHRIWPEIRWLWMDRSDVHFWLGLLIICVWASLSITAVWGEFEKFLAAGIRAYRFTVYLLTPTFIIASVKTPAEQKFLFYVFYFNSVVQAVLAFLQGIGYLPTFWPEYWRVAAYLDYPVGTLSPHHLQIGIVMMLGFTASLTVLKERIPILLRFISLLGTFVMVGTMVFAGIRTAWVALAMMVVMYVVIYRQRAFMLVVGVALGLVILSNFTDTVIAVEINLRAEEEINRRVVRVIEAEGLTGVVQDRFYVYDNFIDVVRETPWVLLIGTGFQNISAALGGPTGAHINYVQVWFELGIFGFIVYMTLLKRFVTKLWATYKFSIGEFRKNLGLDTLIFFAGILVTMLSSETLWAQYSMFTLTGQILGFLAVALCGLKWTAFERDQARF